MIYSKAFEVNDYKDFDQHEYFNYLYNSWNSVVPFRYEHEHRKWEYGLALKVIQEREVKTVLDVGGGSSLFSPGLANLGYDITQVNLDEEGKTVKKQSDFLKKEIKYTQADFLLYKGRKKYDAVVCNSVLEHIPDDTKFFRKLLNYVKIGGVLILTVDYNSSGKQFSGNHLRTYNKEALEKFIKIATKEGFSVYKDKYEYLDIDSVVYDYTFASLILEK